MCVCIDQHPVHFPLIVGNMNVPCIRRTIIWVFFFLDKMLIICWKIQVHHLPTPPASRNCVHNKQMEIWSEYNQPLDNIFNRNIKILVVWLSALHYKQASSCFFFT